MAPIDEYNKRMRISPGPCCVPHVKHATSTSRRWIVLLCIFGSSSVNFVQSTSDYSSSKQIGTFDQDSREDCSTLLQFCHSDVYAHVYVQCAKSCTAYLEDEGMIAKASTTSSTAFYELPSLRLRENGKRIEMDRFEGYTTIVAIVPLWPGMAAYYYQLLEHVHASFFPRVEIILIPVDLGGGIHIKLLQDNNNPRVLVADEETSVETNPLVQYLLSIPPRAGAAQRNHKEETVQLHLAYDRVTVYIVSADAQFVERLVSPTLKKLQQKISVYIKSIDYDENDDEL
jgi:hypothetical protein